MLRKKLNNRTWQKIFISYERKNLYRIYHFLKRKNLLYNKSKINLKKFTDEEWDNSDDFLLIDPLEYIEEQPETITTSALILEKKDVNLL